MIPSRNTIVELQPAAPTTRSSTSSSGQTAQNLMENLYQEYSSCIGHPMPLYLRDAVKHTLEREGEAHYWYLMYALRETSRAPRPSWAYARAIYYRVKNEGVEPELLRVSFMQYASSI